MAIAVLRLALLAACVAAVVYGAVSLHDARACDRAARNVFAMGVTGGAVAGAGDAAGALERSCRGGEELASGAAALARLGAPATARRLAAEATRRDPRDYQGWIARAIAAQRSGDVAAQRAAARRALALNPLYPPARDLSR